jgi:hypothetical protein
MKTRAGAIARGTPLGRSIPNRKSPWCKNPIMLIAVNANNEIVKVTII